jgi:hypothetical protein
MVKPVWNRRRGARAMGYERPQHHQLTHDRGYGSSQMPWQLASQKSTDVITSTTVPVVATIVADLAEPAKSADLSAAQARWVIKCDPTLNMALLPLVGHATDAEDKFGEFMVVGVREVRTAGGRAWLRTVLAHVGFKGSVEIADGTGNPAFLDGVAGSVAPCDEFNVVADYLPAPGVREIGSATGNNNAAAIEIDKHSFTWIEVYGSCSVPSGSVGSACDKLAVLFAEY